MKFHIIYTKIDDSMAANYHEFESFLDAETWLKSIGAKYWEIGIIDACPTNKDIKRINSSRSENR